MREPKTYKDDNGYLRFHDSKKLVHRWAMEKKLGRPLQKGESVHHINGNTFDNSPENLELLTAKEHYKKHVVPILEARREAKIMERLAPIQEAQIIKGIALFSTISGASLFILGLIIRGKLEMWYVGLVFFLVGLVGWLFQRGEKRDES